MDDFLIGPQSDEKEYTLWDYEMDYGVDGYEDMYMDYLAGQDEEVSLSNDLASSTNRSR